MRKSRFTDEQITGILAELEAGHTAAEVSRRHNVSTYTIYQWRKRFGALKAQDVKRMRAMSEEITKLKRIVADQAIELVVAKDLLRKKF
jgi:putative transposase